MNNNTLERLEAGVRSVLAQKSLDHWLVGLVYDETDKHLTPLQRNGTRWMHFFHVGPYQPAVWQNIVCPAIESLTGYPASAFTWQVCTEDDGWPSAWMLDGQLPIGHLALLAWLGDDFDTPPLRVDCIDRGGVEIWWRSGVPLDAQGFLDLIIEERAAVSTTTCKRCSTRIIRRQGVWIDKTGGDACSNDVHAP